MSSFSGAQTVVVVVAMLMATGWMWKIVNKTMDLYYKPRLDKWVRDRPYHSSDCSKDFCMADRDAFEAGGDDEDLYKVFDDEYLAALELELISLKAQRDRDLLFKQKQRLRDGELSAEVVEDDDALPNYDIDEIGCCTCLLNEEKACPKLSYRVLMLRNSDFSLT